MTQAKAVLPREAPGDAIGGGKIDTAEIRNIGQVLAMAGAPIPKFEHTQENWRRYNGGWLASDSFKSYLDPSDPDYSKEKTAQRYKAIKTLPPAKSGEPDAGYLMADALHDEYHLVFNRTGTPVKVTHDGISYGDAKIAFKDVAPPKKGETTIVIRGVGKDTVIDLSGVELPKDMKLNLEVNAMRGAPTIILPRRGENVSIVVEGADVETQVEQEEKKRQVAVVNFEAPAGVFSQATVRGDADRNLFIHTAADKSGLRLQVRPPIYSAFVQTKTEINFLLKAPGNKEIPVRIGQVTTGAVKKPGDVLDIKDIIPPSLEVERRLQEKLRAATPAQPPMKKPEGKGR